MPVITVGGHCPVRLVGAHRWRHVHACFRGRLNRGICGDVFTASCDVEPTSCAFAWLMLLLSVVAHAMMHCCVTNGSESDDEEPNAMYS